MKIKEMPTPEVHIGHVVFQAQAEIALAVSEIIEEAGPGERIDVRCTSAGIAITSQPIGTHRVERNEQQIARPVRSERAEPGDWPDEEGPSGCQ